MIWVRRDCCNLGGNRTFSALRTNGRSAQNAYFAKSHERPKITARVAPARCDAAFPNQTLIRCCNIIKVLRSVTRTKQTFAAAAIADAENLRICSVAHSAQQRISPYRSFDRVRTHAIRTTYSLNAVSTIEMWRKRKCAMIAQLIGLRCPESSTFVFVRNIR